MGAARGPDVLVAEAIKLGEAISSQGTRGLVLSVTGHRGSKDAQVLVVITLRSLAALVGAAMATFGEEAEFADALIEAVELLADDPPAQP